MENGALAGNQDGMEAINMELQAHDTNQPTVHTGSFCLGSLNHPQDLGKRIV